MTSTMYETLPQTLPVDYFDDDEDTSGDEEEIPATQLIDNEEDRDSDDESDDDEEDVDLFKNYNQNKRKREREQQFEIEVVKKVKKNNEKTIIKKEFYKKIEELKLKHVQELVGLYAEFKSKIDEL